MGFMSLMHKTQIELVDISVSFDSNNSFHYPRITHAIFHVIVFS